MKQTKRKENFLADVVHHLFVYCQTHSFRRTFKVQVKEYQRGSEWVSVFLETALFWSTVSKFQFLPQCTLLKEDRTVWSLGEAWKINIAREQNNLYLHHILIAFWYRHLLHSTWHGIKLEKRAPNFCVKPYEQTWWERKGLFICTLF